MSIISKEQFSIQYPNTPEEKNVGVNYSSRLSNLEDIKNKTSQIDKIESYVTKDLDALKSKIINTQKAQELTQDYKNVIKQRQSARWINTRENRWNKAIMTKENFINETKKLWISEINNNTSAYEAVFILLKKLWYLDDNISHQKSLSRKSPDEKAKFMALVKFQAQEQSAEYSTTTAKASGVKTLEIDGIIWGGTLKALIENYKKSTNNQQNIPNEQIDNIDNTDNTTDTHETNETNNQEQKEQEKIDNLPDYKWITIDDTHSYIQIEWYGKTVYDWQTTIQIDEQYGEWSNKSLWAKSYKALIQQEQFTNTKIDKTDPTDPTTRTYYKKLWQTRTKINNFQTTIQNKKDEIQQLTERIKTNGEKINQAKTEFETTMNSIFDNTNKSRRNFQLTGGSFGNFENQKLFDNTLRTTGIKKLNFKKNRLSTKKTSININFNYNINTWFQCTWQEKISNSTTLFYQRDPKTQKLIISEQEETTPDIPNEIAGLSEESINRQNLHLTINWKNRTFNLKNFVNIQESEDKNNKTTNTFTINWNNFILLKDDGLWIVPVKFNSTNQKREFDKTQIQKKNLYQIDKRKIWSKNNDTITQYQLIQKLKTWSLSDHTLQALITPSSSIQIEK